MKRLLKLTSVLLVAVLFCLLVSSCGGATGSGTGDTSAMGTETTGKDPAGGGSDPSGEETTGDNRTDTTGTPDGEGENPVVGVAAVLIDSFGNVPDAWSFLPEAFSVEHSVIDASDIPDYQDFTAVSAIPQNYIGKQLNVVVGVLNTCESALGYVNTVYGALNTVEAAYQAFINDHPDDYAAFGGTAGAFSYEILLDGKKVFLSASLGAVNVMLFSDGADATYGARIQFGDGNVLKYTVTEEGLKVALNVLNVSSTQIEFVRDVESPENVIGYIYEYLTVSGQELIATSTLLSVNESYTTVVGTKGDFIPTADSINCEVYDSQTGRLVGTEVKESLGDGDRTYHTLWYNLADITGITSIKKIDDYNGVNPDTIYINGKSDSVHSMFVNGLFDTSRRFDIEFKQVTSYIYDAAEDQYTAVEYEVPMMFVQEANLDSFEEDYENKNDVSVSLQVSEADREAVYYGYHVLVEAYDLIRSAVTQQDIIDYCAENIQTFF